MKRQKKMKIGDGILVVEKIHDREMNYENKYQNKVQNKK